VALKHLEFFIFKRTWRRFRPLLREGSMEHCNWGTKEFHGKRKTNCGYSNSPRMEGCG